MFLFSSAMLWFVVNNNGGDGCYFWNGTTVPISSCKLACHACGCYTTSYDVSNSAKLSNASIDIIYVPKWILHSKLPARSHSSLHAAQVSRLLHVSQWRTGYDSRGLRFFLHNYFLPFSLLSTMLFWLGNGNVFIGVRETRMASSPSWGISAIIRH